MVETEEGSDHKNGPDGGWGWIVVLGCTMIMAFTWGQQVAFGVYLVSITETLGVDVSATAPIQGLNTAICLMMEDRLAMGIVTSGAGLGSLVLPLLGKWLIDAYGYEGAMLINGAIVLNTVACIALYRPLHLHDQRHVAEDTLGPAISVTASTSELLQYGEFESTKTDSVLGGESVTQDDRSLNLQQGDLVAEVSRSDEDRSSVTVVVTTRQPVATPGTHKKKGFAWEIFNDARLWVLCVMVGFVDVGTLTAPIYLPLLSIEVGGDDINEAAGVSMSGIIGTIILVIISLIWDLGVFRRPHMRQIGYAAFAISTGVTTLVAGFLQSYAVLMCWVIFVVPVTTAGSLSTFYIVVRDIATPENYPDALSTINLIEAPSMLIFSIVFGLVYSSSGSASTTYVALGLCTALGGAIAAVMPLLTIFYYRPKDGEDTREPDLNPTNTL
ncbi:PREDICTED: monocarboxylate transporter 9-like [Priapulus caudatus]|uniref:Monocarboxylate transporter 9-like n=1 Tax=Priapulus caudatus TaxID=37621 RepID=A0ABM1EUH1_PRICU|nr:PREDICTED: monocarboxylate transporter 9-like [Priapulus caudatus]